LLCLHFESEQSILTDDPFSHSINCD
jgi:hypothetical protein